jgi:pimeloyl-ACP methyl ester carboxylesterase
MGTQDIRAIALLAAAALIALPATPGSTAGPEAATPRVDLAPCRLEHPYGLGSVAARCGRLAVPENPGDPDGRRIELAIAVVPAVSARARPDPLFLLAGGPGQGARDAFVPVLGTLAGVRRDRDIVLVDQRGTGGSNRMDCDFPDETFDAEVDAEKFRGMARDCLAGLPGDPRYYTTSVAVGDLDAVRAALGYERINLYGGSYGTRVAQQYLRRYPGHSRTVILDGVVNPSLALGASMALDAEHALRADLARCSRSTACAARYPTLAADFDSLRARLAEHPVTVKIADPVTAEPREVSFTAGHLALVTRLLIYSDNTAALLPLLVHEALDRDNFAPLAAQAEMVQQQLEDALAYGMHNAVVCSEDLPFLDRTAIDQGALDRSFLGSAMLDGLTAMCEVWPRGVVDPDLKEPLRSAVPALLLSGEFDPVTPPAYAAAAAAGFNDHAAFVFKGQGHIQLGLKCAQSLVRHFLDAGTAVGLDAHCVDSVEAAPFFLGFNGGAP